MSCEGCPYKGQRYVGPEGPKWAKIAVVGEAPGAEEEREGRPFVGGSGKVLDGMLSRAGIRREECFFTNVLKCRPPNNDITTPAAAAAIRLCSTQLKEELSALRSNVIAAVGATALSTIMGHDGLKISTARGAIIQSPYGKLIPTYHPAYIMRNWDEYITSIYDWRKVKRHSEFAGYTPLNERFVTFPTVDQVELFCRGILADGRYSELAIDLETYFCDSPFQTPIKLLGMATGPEEAYVIPFITESGNLYWQTDDDARRVIMAVASVLESPQVTKWFHNALFDVPILMNHGFTVVGPVMDAMVGHSIVFNHLPHSLQYLVSIYADYHPWKAEKGAGDDYLYRNYNARDCCVLFMVKDGLMKDIENMKLQWLFNTLMHQIIPTSRMMCNGIYFDVQKRDETITEMDRQIEEARNELEQLSGVRGFNPLSPTQLSRVLFEVKKLRSGVHTKGGLLSTSEDVLKRLALRYPSDQFPQAVLDYRRLTKLRDFADQVPGPDGRIHAAYKLTPVTGRFACENPNLQQLPAKKKDKSGIVRKLFCAAPGYRIIAYDFQQAELRIFAQLAGDEPWLKAFSEGEDVHKTNCLDMFHDYSEELRGYAKNFIFGFIYGSEGANIEKILPKELLARVPVVQIIANLKAAHPALFDYRERIEAEILDKKYVITPFGRRRWYPSVPSKEDLRSAFNYPIQATVSDMMHVKMAKIDEALHDERVVLQLHDAIYIECPIGNIERMVRLGRDIMEAPVPAPNGLVFQLPAEAKLGDNLFDMEVV